MNSAVTEVMNLKQFIGGRFQEPNSKAYIDNFAPATGEVLAKIPRGDAHDVNGAVEAAGRAFENVWASASMAERAELCDAVARHIERNLEYFAHLESQDTGKPIALARTIDIPRAIANFRFFAGAARHDQTGFHEMHEALNYTTRRPLGPVGLITPWNLPLYLLSWKTAPALVMGNTVVAKPSELTPLTAHALAEAFQEVGAPDGIFNLVQGFGAEAGQALVQHPEIKAISFTGGTTTGARVAATAAPQFKKLSLELGGKNPTLVFADCDFEGTVAGALRAAFTNQGQVCLCGSRLFVEASLYDKFESAFVDAAHQLAVGDPSREQTGMGALISAQHRDKVESYIQLAQTEGGRILSGGKRPSLEKPFDDGYFLEPTVIAGLPADCRTATEEIFGPVVTLHPFESEDEAVRLANGVAYGLSASVWTRDLQRAHRVSDRLQCGMVWVNTWLLRDLRVPFGGVKASGVGREGGRFSLEFFSESKNICIYLGKS